MKFIPLASTLTLALSLWSAPATAQAPATPAAATPERTVLRQLYGDLAFEVRTKGQGSLLVGVADARTSLVVNFMATDLRRWSDSATRMLTATPRKGQTAKWEAVVAGPGVTAGSMSLARSISPGDTSLILLVTDTAFRGVRTALTMTDAKALAGAMKRAAMSSLPTKVPPMASAPPATKTPPPPAKKPPSAGSR